MVLRKIDENFFKRSVIIIGMLILIIFSFLIAQPFLIAIFLAMVLAYIFYPIYYRINKIIKRPNLVTALFCLFVLIVFTIPIWFFLPEVLRQTFETLRTIQQTDVVAPLRNIAPHFFISSEVTRDLTVVINQGVTRLTNTFMGRLEGMIIDLPIIFFQTIIMIVVFFFSLRDGAKIVESLKGLSPLREDSQQKFISRFRNTTKAVIINTFVVGVIQGALAGLGFYLFGVKNPLFLSLLSVFLAMLPIVGPWMVWASVSAMMIVSGNTNGIYLAIYSIVFVELVYQMMILYVFKKVSKISPAIAIIGVLGGLYLFGPAGVILGPLILEYLILFSELYREKKLHELFA